MLCAKEAKEMTDRSRDKLKKLVLNHVMSIIQTSIDEGIFNCSFSYDENGYRMSTGDYFKELNLSNDLRKLGYTIEEEVDIRSNGNRGRFIISWR